MSHGQTSLKRHHIRIIQCLSQRASRLHVGSLNHGSYGDSNRDLRNLPELRAFGNLGKRLGSVTHEPLSKFLAEDID